MDAYDYWLHCQAEERFSDEELEQIEDHYDDTELLEPDGDDDNDYGYSGIGDEIPL